MIQPITLSHSAEVDMWLDCGVHGQIQLSRVTPKSVVAKSPRDIPACSAELIVVVDGRSQRTPVMLTAGFSRHRSAARVLPMTDDAAPF